MRGFFFCLKIVLFKKISFSASYRVFEGALFFFFILFAFLSGYFFCFVSSYIDVVFCVIDLLNCLDRRLVLCLISLRDFVYFLFFVFFACLLG